jgi:hypothetical protein
MLQKPSKFSWFMAVVGAVGGALFFLLRASFWWETKGDIAAERIARLTMISVQTISNAVHSERIQVLHGGETVCQFTVDESAFKALLSSMRLKQTDAVPMRQVAGVTWWNHSGQVLSGTLVYYRTRSGHAELWVCTNANRCYLHIEGGN